jgi:hypothetical protein
MFNNLETLFESLKIYVDNNKIDSYFEYIANNKKVVGNPSVPYSYKVELEKKYKIIKKIFFSESKRKTIKEKLLKIPEENAQYILNKLTERIDLYIKKINNEVQIAKLEELKEIIIEIKDDIDIDEILNVENLCE